MIIGICKNTALGQRTSLMRNRLSIWALAEFMRNAIAMINSKPNSQGSYSIFPDFTMLLHLQTVSMSNILNASKDLKQKH